MHRRKVAIRHRYCGYFQALIPGPSLDARTIKTSFYLIVGAIFELMTFGL
jgi:hypothetical protein